MVIFVGWLVDIWCLDLELELNVFFFFVGRGDIGKIEEKYDELVFVCIWMVSLL
jgi:hypothetical protein